MPAMSSTDAIVPPQTEESEDGVTGRQPGERREHPAGAGSVKLLSPFEILSDRQDPVFADEPDNLPPERDEGNSGRCRPAVGGTAIATAGRSVGPRHGQHSSHWVMYHEVHRDDEPRFVAGHRTFLGTGYQNRDRHPHAVVAPGCVAGSFLPSTTRRGEPPRSGIIFACRTSRLHALVTTTFRKTTTAWLAL